MALLTIVDAVRLTGVSRAQLYRYLKGVHMYGVTKAMFTAGYLYWIQLEESCYVKVGVAIDVRERRKELQVGCPFDLKVIRTIPVASMYQAETQAHHDYKEYHVRGEWFRFPAEMVNASPAYLHKHVRLSELKREIALLQNRIASLEVENASLKQHLAEAAI
jgi:hypothetical protein